MDCRESAQYNTIIRINPSPSCAHVSKSRYLSHHLFSPQAAATPYRRRAGGTSPFLPRFPGYEEAFRRPVVRCKSVPATIKPKQPTLDPIMEKVKLMFSQREAISSRSVARVMRNFDDGASPVCLLAQVGSSVGVWAGDGRITKQELAKGVKMYLNKELTNEELERVFGYFDDNGSGSITIDEIVAELCPKTIGQLLQNGGEPQPQGYLAGIATPSESESRSPATPSTPVQSIAKLRLASENTIEKAPKFFKGVGQQRPSPSAAHALDQFGRGIFSNARARSPTMPPAVHSR